MTIGINAAAAVKEPRTGVEEYVYQLIKHLTMLSPAREHRFLLYLPARINNKRHAECRNEFGTSFISASHGIPKQVRDDGKEKYFDFSLPVNFEIKILRWPLPFFWTQIRLAWEMFFNPPDALFIPAHVLPFFSPKNSTVAVHGLEYEYLPKCYSFWRRRYLRQTTKSAARRAKKIIAVSESTKNDLIKLYGVNKGKIEVAHHGISFLNVILAKAGIQDSGFRLKAGMTINKSYLLYLGRIETKKNIQGILEAYKILKEKYKIPHTLVLAGAPGFGYKKLKPVIHDSKFMIQELGYVSEDEKQQLLSGADVFLFPSLYEGFGLPILEAQAFGAPVVASFVSSMPEVAGDGALFVNPRNPKQIAEAVFRIIDEPALRDRLIESGRKNIGRFSWEICAKKTLDILVK